MNKNFAGTCFDRPESALWVESMALRHATDKLAPAHLIAAVLWFISQGIGRAPEGVAFAALLGISVVRLPWTMPQLRAAVRARPFLWVALLMIALWISALWSPSNAHPDWYPPRHFLIPLMLAPLAAQWRTLIAALVIGATFQASWMLLELTLHPGENAYGLPLGSSGKPMQFGSLLATAAVVGATMAVSSTRSAITRIAWLSGAVISFAALLSIANRTNIVACAAALIAAIALLAWWRLGFGKAAIGVLCALGLAAIAAGGLARERLFSIEDDRGVSHLVERYTSIRTWIWGKTFDAVSEKPLLGHGRDAWAVTYTARVESIADSELPEPRAKLLELNTAHSTYMQALHDQGIVGLTLLVITLGSIARWGLQRPSLASVLLLALTARWALTSTMESELNTSHGLAPFGFLCFLVIVAGCVTPSHGAMRWAFRSIRSER